MNDETTQAGMVQLRTGDSVPRGVVLNAWLALRALQSRNHLDALAEACELGRDSNYRVWPHVVAELKAIRLMTDQGSVHDYTRAVLRAAFDGEGLDIRLVHPITGEPA